MNSSARASGVVISECASALPAAAEQQLLKPVSEVNADVQEFLDSFVKPESFWHGSSYTCRRTCFTILTKSARHNVALRKLLCTLRVSVSTIDVMR